MQKLENQPRYNVLQPKVDGGPASSSASPQVGFKPGSPLFLQRYVGNSAMETEGSHLILQRKCDCGSTQSLEEESEECASPQIIQRWADDQSALAAVPLIIPNIARQTANTELMIDQPGDAHELEADQVADHIMQIPDSVLKSSHIPGESHRFRQNDQYGALKIAVPVTHPENHRQTINRKLEIGYECTDLLGRCPADSKDATDSREAMKLFRETAEGKLLLNELHKIKGLNNSHITVDFSSAIVRHEGGVYGSFYPIEVGAPKYTVYIDLPAHQSIGKAKPRKNDEPLPKPTSTYGGGDVVIPSYVVERTSKLAETVFHELLHIWYVNTYNEFGVDDPRHPQFQFNDDPSTGHLDASKGYIEEPFARRLGEFSKQIYFLETAPLKPAPKSSQPRKESEPGLSIQRTSTNLSSNIITVPSVVQDVLRTPGQPLDGEIREFMEPRFGQDFSHVRTHTDARAADSAKAVNALAYTVGRDVVFGRGQYLPSTGEGRRLIAHELAHVVQQEKGGGIASIGNGSLARSELHLDQRTYANVLEMPASKEDSLNMPATGASPVINRIPYMNPVSSWGNPPKLLGQGSQLPVFHGFIQRQAVSAPPRPSPAKSELSCDELNNDAEFNAVANTLLKMEKGVQIKLADWKLLAKYAWSFMRIPPLFLRKESRAVPSSGDRSSVSDTLDSSSITIEQRLAISAFPQIFSKYIMDEKISWENVTEDQRIVFLALDRPTGEYLRKETLKNSPLFNAITTMHIPTGQSDATTKHMRERIQKMRLREPATTGGAPEAVEQYVYTGSAADEIMWGRIAIPALVDPVAAAGYDLSIFQNKALAQYIARTPAWVLVKAAEVYACGIAHLAAIAFSRGKMHLSDYSGVMQVSDVARWLKEWSLDKKQGEGLLSFNYDYIPTQPWHNPLGYHPVNNLKTLSRETVSNTRKVKVSSDPFAARAGVEAAASKRFTRLIGERLAKPPELNPTQEARLALVQGSDHTHSFIVYKDIDDVWRSMDVYLDLEDTAWNEFGVPGTYSANISTLYFVLDPKVTRP